MRKLITILFVCLLVKVSVAQTTYYVSNTGSDGNNGTSQATAWQTLSKVNSATFNPGDQILFKRGDIFVGRITVNQSGTSGNPITFGAYGTGANPVFNSLRSVTSWTNLGGNIWESTNSVSVLPTLKLVLINGINTPMGRYPNGDATYPFLPNYFTIDSHTGTGNGATTITSSSLTTDWTGADVVVRVNHWTLDKEPITSQTDTTISFTGQTTSDPISDGWGFWIQNDPRTLDRQNEWYYNPSSKKIRIYSTSQPNDVKVTTTDTLIYSRVHDYITINNIDFKGANTSAIVFSACNNMTVTNCNFQYTGATAIEANDGSNNLDVENCTFYDIGGACVWNTDGGANWIIKNNTMKRIGLVSVIKNNDYTNGPIEIFSSNALVQYNNIDSTAYEGIHFRGNNVQIRNNFVNHTSMLRDDGGGIYTGFSNETGKIIEGNIVLNSIGNSRGVGSHDAAGNGIYLDGLSDGITVLNNTIAHIVSAGLFLNNDRGISAHNNTIYDIGGDYWTKGNLMIQTYSGAPYSSYQRNMNVTNNIFFQKKPSQVNVFYYTGDATNAISNFGILDSNYYAKAIDTTFSIMYRASGGDYQNLTFSQWQAASGKEAHGQYLNQLVDTNNIKFVYNPTQNDSTVSLGAIYKDVKGVSYNNTITLQPYRSAILIYDSPSTPAPTISMSGTQNITDNSTSVFATGFPASGQTITGYQWSVTSGGSVTFGTPTASSTTVSGLAVGTYVLRCTVTQSDGQTAYGEVTIVVNNSVTANAGPDATIYLTQTSIATLDGSASSGTSYQWTEISTDYMSGATITSPTTKVTTVTGLPQGVFYFELAATTGGTTEKDTVVIKVDNDLPPANATLLKSLPLQDPLFIDKINDRTDTVTNWNPITDPNESHTTYFQNSTESIWIDRARVNGMMIDSLRGKFYSIVEDGYKFYLSGAEGDYNRSELGYESTFKIDTNKTYMFEWKGYFPQQFGFLNANGTQNALTIFQLHPGDEKRTLLQFAIEEDGNFSLFETVYNDSATQFQFISKKLALLSDFYNNTHTLRTIIKEGKGYSGQDAFVKVELDGVQVYYRDTGNVGSSAFQSDYVKYCGMYDYDRILVNPDSLSRGRKVSLATESFKTFSIVNQLPTANAGSDVTITLPVNSLTLSGSGTDSDGTIASYSWSKVSGGSYSIDNANIANPTLSNLVAGTYIFQLTVTDNQGAIGTDYVQIDVTPLISIALNGGAGTQTTTNDSTDIGVTVVWASGHNGEVSWTQISGPNTAEITSYLSLQTWVKHLIPGTYTFRCTATQDDGQTVYVDATVKVLVPLIITPGQTFNLRTKTILYNQ